MSPKIETIICATDLSLNGNQIIPLAATLAKRYQAKLIIAHVIKPPTAHYGGIIFNAFKYLEDKKAQVEEIVSPLLSGLGGFNLEIIIKIGFPAQEILKLSEEVEADLVMAIRIPKGGFDRFLLGSVSKALMHILKCPFILMSSPKNWQIGRNVFNKILVGCDFSKDSLLAVEWGVKLALSLGVELHLATVIPENKSLPLVKQDAKEPSLDEILFNDLIELIPQDLEFHIPPTAVILNGEPHISLNKYATENNFDLIIMGTQGKNIITAFLIGSTTDRIIRIGQQAVMVTKLAS